MILIIGIMIVLAIVGAFGSLLLKKGAARFHITFSIEGVIAILKNWHIMLGAVCYVFTMIVFIYLLKQQELSVLYPLTSLTYIFVTIFSVWILKERINMYKIIGISAIILGVILVTLH